MTQIFTMGHSTHASEHFLGLLARHGIVNLVDVRSRPYSKWAPQYCKDALALSVQGAGSRYVYLGRELGGLPPDNTFRDEAGHVDYALRSQSAEFRSGVTRLLQLAETGATAIMCAEEAPTQCHRRLLITPALLLRKVKVLHIRGDGSVAEDDDVSAASQLSLFE